MESLAYLYSALSYEEVVTVEPPKSDRQPNLFDGLNWKKFSSRACFLLLPFIIGFAVFASPQEAQARTLKYGNRGSDIVYLQKRLKAKGFFPYRVRTTGYFGSTTRLGVRAFQRAYGLRVDGIVGSQTKRYLY